MIGPNRSEEFITVGGDPISVTDSGSFFHLQIFWCVWLSVVDFIHILFVLVCLVYI